MIEKTTFNRCVYIQNHQTELDWLFMCYFLQMFGRESDFSAIMKSAISYAHSRSPCYFSRKVPMFGPIVQELNMCLLDRDWKADQKNFAMYLKQFETHPRPVCVFLCPEGTTITQGSLCFRAFSAAESLHRSQEYAKRNGRPVFEVLPACVANA